MASQLIKKSIIARFSPPWLQMDWWRPFLAWLWDEPAPTKATSRSAACHPSRFKAHGSLALCYWSVNSMVTDLVEDVWSLKLNDTV
jgi:hypothetical protein